MTIQCVEALGRSPLPVNDPTYDGNVLCACGWPRNRHGGDTEAGAYLAQSRCPVVGGGRFEGKPER